MYNVTHDDYSFSERSEQEHWVIHLKTGKWADTYYCYDKVRIVPPEGGWTETEDDNVGTLSFTYGLIESPMDLEDLSLDPEFNDYIGAVLQHIVEDSFAKGDYRLGDGESRDNNTTEPDQF